MKFLSKIRAYLIRLLLPNPEQHRRSREQCGHITEMLSKELLEFTVNTGKLPPDTESFTQQVMDQLQTHFSQEEWLLYGDVLSIAAKEYSREHFQTFVGSRAEVPYQTREVCKIKDSQSHAQAMRTLEEDGYPPATVDSKLFTVKSTQTPARFEVVEVDDQEALLALINRRRGISGLPPIEILLGRDVT